MVKKLSDGVYLLIIAKKDYCKGSIATPPGLPEASCFWHVVNVAEVGTSVFVRLEDI